MGGRSVWYAGISVFIHVIRVKQHQPPSPRETQAPTLREDFTYEARFFAPRGLDDRPLAPLLQFRARRRSPGTRRGEG